MSEAQDFNVAFIQIRAMITGFSGLVKLAEFILQLLFQLFRCRKWDSQIIEHMRLAGLDYPVIFV